MPRKSARVDCLAGSFWVAPRLFWRWVREGLVECKGEQPLSGRYKGGPNDFQVSINHIILDQACPEHLSEVLRSHRQKK